MKTWLVDTYARDAREHDPDVEVAVAQFLYRAPTERDAIEAGRRRLLGEQALADLKRSSEPIAGRVFSRYTLVGDAVEARTSDTREAAADAAWLADKLAVLGWDCWREGVGGVLVFGRRS